MLNGANIVNFFGKYIYRTWYMVGAPYWRCDDMMYDDVKSSSPIHRTTITRYGDIHGTQQCEESNQVRGTQVAAGSV